MNSNTDIEILQESKHFDYFYRILFVGRENVGKTYIYERLKSNTFSENYTSTVELNSNDFFVKIDELILRLVMHDSSGKTEFGRFMGKLLIASHLLILVYSVNE